MVRWRAAADGKLVVLVDSVDEAATSMRKLTDQLLFLLDDLSAERLLLRVAGRSAAFPTRLRENLSARFAESYQELNLAPLTWKDVAQAAAAELGIKDAAEFMTAIAERGIGVLASRPITLPMLLRIYGEGPLPASRIDLYERAIDRLVREMNPRRLDEAVRDIPIAQRRTAARTLAAISVLAGHASIALHRYQDMPEGQLCLDEVTESSDELTVFAAVAGSALFTATSESTVRWTHRDFPEFLAGQSLAMMETRDAIALLSDPNQPDRIVPQLIGAAVWAAHLHEQLFDWLLDREPELLLSANLADTQPAVRRRVVQALLTQMKNRPPGNWHASYRGLDYDELADDVAPYLDARMPVWLRREAIWLLGTTGQHELDDQLADIVESAASAGKPGDNDENVRLAVSAIFCLRDTSDSQVLDRLTSVVLDAGAPRTIRAGIISDLWLNRPTGDVLHTLRSAALDDSHSDLVGPIGQGLAEAALQHRVALGPVVDWLAANGLPQTAPEDDEQDGNGTARPNADWVWAVEACLLSAITNPGELTDEQWNKLAVLYSSLLLYIADPFRWRRDEIGHAPDDGRRTAAAAVLRARSERHTTHFLIQAGLLRSSDLTWVMRQHANAPPGSDLAHAYRFAAQNLGQPTKKNQELARSIVNGSEPLARLVDELFSDQQVADHANTVAAQRQQKAEKDARIRTASFNRDRLIAATATRSWADTSAELRRPHAGKKWAHGTALTASPAWQTLNRALQAAVVDTATSYLAELTAA